MRKILPLLPFLLLLLLWQVISSMTGGIIVPSPKNTAVVLVQLLISAETWRHIFLTLSRGFLGLAAAGLAAYLFGIPCGLNRRLLAFFSPLVIAGQSCPPIVWISLLLVWISFASVVPIIVVFVSTFPPLFLNIAQGTAALDPKLLAMASFYRVPKTRRLLQLLLPGITHHSLAAFSFALGITWKVTATAEFFSSSNGIGARIFWAYRNLEMPTLFAWSIIIALLGVLLEITVIQTLRRQAQQHGGKDD